jgi:hypothetical protein
MITRFQAPAKQLPELIDLEYPDMGKVIFYYRYAHNTGNKNYIKKVDDLLDEIFLSLESGLNTANNEIYKISCGIILPISAIPAHPFR